MNSKIKLEKIGKYTLLREFQRLLLEEKKPKHWNYWFSVICINMSSFNQIRDHDCKIKVCLLWNYSNTILQTTTATKCNENINYNFE